MISHQGFDPGDAEAMTLYVREILDGPEAVNGSTDPDATSDEIRVVMAYLRRRKADVKAVRLREAGDLLAAVERVAASEPEVV